MLPKFAYIRPTSVGQAVQHLVSGGVVHAGGTDLLGCLRDRVFHAEKLVSIQGLNELRGIRRSGDGGLRIGALTTLTEIVTHADIGRYFAALAHGAAAAA